MTSGSYDPFEYQRRQRRLIEEAMGGNSLRLIKEQQDRVRSMQELGLTNSAKSAFEQYKEHERFLQQPGIANSVQELVERERETYRQITAPLSAAMEKIQLDNTALARTFEVGSFGAAKAFQERMAEVMAVNLEPFSGIVEQLREADVFTRIAEQQAELVRIGSGLSSQLDTVRTAMQSAIPSASELSAAFGMQSALSENLKRISEQIGTIDTAAFAGLRESDIWETLRDEYELEADAPVSLALAQIGDRLSQADGVRFTVTPKQIWTLIQVLFFIYSVYAVMAGYGYSPDDRAQADETSAKIERIEKELLEAKQRELEQLIAEASAFAELQRIEELPEAFVVSAANLRAEPSGKAERVQRLGDNTTVFIEERKGRWFRVIYHNPPTDEYREGWVWHESIELLSEG